MELFDSEELLVSSNNDRLKLTTHRIQLNNRDWGSSYRIVVFLEDISSIEVKYSSLFIALIVGIFLIIGGFSLPDLSSDYTRIFVGVGIFLVFIWILSRRHVVSITPDGGKAVNFEIGRMSSEEVDDFIHKVQLAKLARRTK